MMVNSPLAQHAVFYVVGIALGLALGAAVGQQYIREHHRGNPPRNLVTWIGVGSLVLGVVLGWAIDAFITYQNYLRMAR
jgi:small basic protein